MQLALLDRENPCSSLQAALASRRRRTLSQGAWIDYRPQWLARHGELFDQLHADVAWQQTTQELFERTVQTPRLVASFPNHGALPPVVFEIAQVLSGHYGVTFDSISAALYRNGKDSVAWHRDRGHRDRPSATVAIVSLGAPRPFLLRPYRAAGTPAGGAITYRLGWGDLLVMGGTAQRTWQHAVPKVRHADPRISLMFRHQLQA